MIKVGDMVKIEDIGALALCVRSGENEVMLDLEGEQFWISSRLCQSVADMENEMEDAT